MKLFYPLLAVLFVALVVYITKTQPTEEGWYNYPRRNWYWRMYHHTPQWLNRRYRRWWPFRRLNYWWNARNFYHPFYHRRYRGFF